MGDTKIRAEQTALESVASGIKFDVGARIMKSRFGFSKTTLEGLEHSGYLATHTDTGHHFAHYTLTDTGRTRVAKGTK